MMQFSPCLLPPGSNLSPGGLSVSDLSFKARRLLAAAAATGVTVGVMAVGGTAPASAGPSADAGPAKSTAKDVLGAHDRGLLAEAVSKGQEQVTILVATEKGHAEAVAAELAELGGTVAR